MRNQVESSSSFVNTNTNNTKKNSVKEESSNDDASEVSDDDGVSRQRRHSENTNNNNVRNDNDDVDVDDNDANRVCRTKSYGELPYSETAAFRQINMTTTENVAGSSTESEVYTAASDGEISTATAHPGDAQSRILREAPEYQSVWKLFPSTQIQDLALHFYKYAHIAPLINNAQQLTRMLCGIDKC